MKTAWKIGNWQQLGLARGEPVGSRRSLTLRAVAIAARVLGDAHGPAIVASLDMTAERRRPAIRDHAHHAPLDPGEASGVLLQIGLARCAW